MSDKVIKKIRTNYVVDRLPTGIIQDRLMKTGLTLEQADDYIEHWNSELPKEWFDEHYQVLCTMQGTSEFGLKKLKKALLEKFDIGIVFVTSRSSGTDYHVLLYNTCI